MKEASNELKHKCFIPHVSGRVKCYQASQTTEQQLDPQKQIFSKLCSDQSCLYACLTLLFIENF